MKRDPYNSVERWNKWIEDKPKIEGTLKSNSDLIISFLKESASGMNVSKSARKGQRSPIRLNALKSRLTFFAKQYSDKPLTKLTKEQIHKLFNDMREGKLTKENGKPYKSVGSYVKDWKTFWNWLIKTKQVKVDINEDLARTDEKPAWVYLTEEQFKTLAHQCSPDYQPLVWLMLDCSARVTEAFNIRVCDFEDDFKKLTIRAETSKNDYERTIHLKLCTKLIKEYVKFYHLSGEDYLFQKKPAAMNKYLKEKCIKLFGEGISHPKAKGRFSEFSLYSIRHIGSTYWLKRYNTHRALMYRMAWTSEKWIKYYSEFLGQNDEISDEDMLTQEDRTRLQEIQIEFKKQGEKVEQLTEKVSTLLTHEDKVMKANKQSHEVLKKLISLSGEGKLKEEDFVDLLKTMNKE